MLTGANLFYFVPELEVSLYAYQYLGIVWLK